MDTKAEIELKFDEMIKKSWTYNLFSEEEAMRWQDIFDHVTNPNFDGHIRGRDADRWRQLNNCYHAFITGLGYPNGKFKSK